MPLFQGTQRSLTQPSDSNSALSASSRRGRRRPLSLEGDNTQQSDGAGGALSDGSVSEKVAEDKQVRFQVTLSSDLIAKVKSDAAAHKLPVHVYVALVLESSLGKVKMQVG